MMMRMLKQRVSKTMTRSDMKIFGFLDRRRRTRAAEMDVIIDRQAVI